MLIFKDLEIGESFYMNGTQWEKKSTRTAWLLDKHGINPTRYIKGKLWFYFSNNEQVKRMGG